MKARFWSTLLVLVLLFTPALALAQPASPVTLTVEAGLDGYYQVGHWLPVQAIIENNGPSIDGRVEVVLPRVNGGAVTYAYPVSLPTQSRKEITLNLFPDQYLNSIKVSLVDNGGQVIATQSEQLQEMGSNDRLYGLLADQPSAFNVLTEIDPPGGAARVAQLTARHLPDRPAALDVLDTLIVSNVDTGALTDAQRTALSVWIANGGRLIVSGGSGWQKTSAGLHSLLPFQPEGTMPLVNLSALKSLAGVTTDPGSAIVATGSLTPDAQTIADQDGTTLIARRPHGLGEIYFLSFDPAVLRQWDGLSAFYRHFVVTAPEKPSWSHGVRDWYTASTAASMIPNLNLPPVSLICGFLVIYMIAIGPLNYFIVRTLKRRELAWISVPLFALGFLAATFLVGTLLRGSVPMINRLALIQVWPNADRARLTGIVGLYAPQRAAYQVKADQGLLLHPPSDDVPYRSTDDTSTWTVSTDADTQRARVEMDVSEVKTLSAEGDVAAPHFAVEMQLLVDDRGARATGSVVNNSDLTLQDAVLLGPGVANKIGTIKPGDSVPITFQLERASRSMQVDDPNVAPYGNVDSTLEDIVGPVYYYGNPDSTQARRNEMLRSILNTYNTPFQQGRGNGTYLAGWSDRPALQAGVDGTTFGAYDTTLYIIDLNPSLKIMSGTLTLPPGMFNWKAENVSGPTISPYDTDVYPGTHTLQFNLARPIAYETVQDLTMHWEGAAANQQSVNIALWNYRTKDWTPLPNLKAGDNPIPDAAQYVGPGGEIRVQLQSGANAYSRFDRLDFTLTVQ